MPPAALAEIGVGFDRSGKLSLDSTLFNEAMSSSAVDVQRLFMGDGATAGVFESMTSAIDQYTDAGALISNTRDRISDQIVALDGRLLSMENRLALRRAALQKEYLAADQMMTQLSSQSGSLSSLSNQYRLF
jgi:flagellar hook-associated protein 2